ncbi:hypothetical protein RKD37_006127 [Streptomyces ambofaciens]
MAAQYIGYSRVTREMKKSRGVRPHALMQMTKPLMRKKSSTPRRP